MSMNGPTSDHYVAVRGFFMSLWTSGHVKIDVFEYVLKYKF